MGRLIFNIALYEQLKVNVKFWLSLLPFSMMICSVFSILVVGEWAERLLENYSFLLIPLMLLGFSLGWESNKLIARWYFKWTTKKVNNVFSNSEVPREWYKENGFEKYRRGLIEEYETEGDEAVHPAYSASKSALFFYITLCCYFVIFEPFIDGRAITHWDFFLWPGPIYGVILGSTVLLSIYYTSHIKKRVKQYLITSTYLNFDKNECEEAKSSADLSTFGVVLNHGQLIINSLYTVFCLFLSVLTIHYALLDETLHVPPKESLQQVSGKIISVKEKDNHIDFTISSSPMTFRYPKTAGASDEVFDSLKRHYGAHATVLNEILSYRAVDTNKAKHIKAYEIHIENRIIRTYEQSLRSFIIWRVISGLMGFMILVFGVFMAIGTWLTYKEKE